MLNLSIAGTLGRDAETRQAGQSLVTNFSVAVSGFDYRKKEKTTVWVRVAIWGQRGQQLAPMLLKGGKAAVSGEMTLSEYNGKVSVELKAQDVTLLGGKPRADRDSSEEQTGKSMFGSHPSASDEDDPFPDF